MIGEVYSESDINLGVLPLTESYLYENVTRASVESTVHRYGRVSCLEVQLPYNCYADGELTLGSNRVFLDNVFVGDRRLVGSGTGRRLIRAFANLALELDNTCEVMNTSWTRLGALNAIHNVFPSRVTAKMGNSPEHWYGYGTERSLEDMFMQHPPIVGKAYQVFATETRIKEDA